MIKIVTTISQVLILVPQKFATALMIIAMGWWTEITITNLTTTNITSSSAKLNWTSSSTPTGFHVNYKKSGSSSWQTVLVPGASRSVTINSLSRNQTYNWRIRALCGKNLTDYSSTAILKSEVDISNHSE